MIDIFDFGPPEEFDRSLIPEKFHLKDWNREESIRQWQREQGKLVKAKPIKSQGVCNGSIDKSKLKESTRAWIAELVAKPTEPLLR